MSAELVAAIDKAVEFVRKHLREDTESLTCAQVEEFSSLADSVYRLAYRVGLHDALPKQSDLRSELEATAPTLGPVSFETKLNLPGDWHVVHSAEMLERLKQPLLQPWSFHLEKPGEVAKTPEPIPESQRVFSVCESDRWFHDLEVLRAMAAELAPAPKAPLDLLSDDAWLTHVDIAKALLLAPDPLRKRLDRWRKNNRGEGWREIEPGPRQPKYLYQVGAIRQVLREALGTANQS